MNTTVESLVSITNVTMTTPPAPFLDAMVAAINELSEEAWNNLPDDGKSWFNEAAKIIENTDEGMGYTLPLIPGMGMEEEAQPEKEASSEPEKNEETQPEKETIGKEEKKAKKPKREGPPVTQLAREIFCSDISMTLEELLTKLEEKGIEIKKSTAQNVYLNALRSFETAIELGEVEKAGKVVLKAQ